MFVNMKLDVSWLKGITFHFNFEWLNQNEVGNIAILVLRKDREKLYSSFCYKYTKLAIMPTLVLEALLR